MYIEIIWSVKNFQKLVLHLIFNRNWVNVKFDFATYKRRREKKDCQYYHKNQCASYLSHSPQFNNKRHFLWDWELSKGNNSHCSWQDRPQHFNKCFYFSKSSRFFSLFSLMQNGQWHYQLNVLHALRRSRLRRYLGLYRIFSDVFNCFDFVNRRHFNCDSTHHWNDRFTFYGSLYHIWS